MPELPEVETIARGLRSQLVGRTVCEVRVAWPRTVALPALDQFETQLCGRQVQWADRRGKYLILGLDKGFLLLHLKMSGRLRVVPASEPPGPHTRLSLYLDNEQQLRFDDARKFGRAYLVDDPAEITAALGPEPLDAGFAFADFQRRLERRSSRLKPLLLNQQFLAGVGNIYADEVLFAARLHPLRLANTLSQDEQVCLYEALRRVLRRAVESRGSTLEDGGYVDVQGEAGEYQQEIGVYGRTGQPCPRCGCAIERISISQRSAHFCPVCQPAQQPLDFGAGSAKL